MVDKLKNDKGPGSFEEDLEDGDRPTVTPPFDVEKYARDHAGVGDSQGVTMPSPPLPASAAPPSKEDPKERKGAPSSEGPRKYSTLLSLANANAPSNPPPSMVQGDPFFNAPFNAQEDEGEPNHPATAVDPPIGHRPASDSLTANSPAQMRERFALGDFSGALAVAEAILKATPAQTEALDCADRCMSVLQQMYRARIGPLHRVPVVDVKRDQMRWLSIDHRAGFVLSLVDGVSSLEMILDVSGMPTFDALRILDELVQQRIISFR